MSCGSTSTANASAVGRAFCNQTPGDLGEFDHFLTCPTNPCPPGCSPTVGSSNGCGQTQVGSSCAVRRKRITDAVETGVDPRIVLRNGLFKYSRPDLVNYSFAASGLIPLTQPVTTAGVVLQSGTPNVNHKGAWNNFNYTVPQTGFYHFTATIQYSLLGKSAGAERDLIYFQLHRNATSLSSVTVGEPAQEGGRLRTTEVHFSGKHTKGDVIDVFAFLDPADDVNQNVEAFLQHIKIAQPGSG